MEPAAFTDDDFESPDGMMTSIWGPPLWMALHTISFNFPIAPTDADRKRFARWLVSTGSVLPCVYCRRNFANNLETAGYFDRASFADREAFSRLVYRLHDAVNVQLGKPESPPYEEVRQMYEGFRARCLKPHELAQQMRRQLEPSCAEPKFRGAKGQCVISVEPRCAKRESTIVVDDRCVPLALE